MKICYLCGNPNPENKDHFPPRTLLNKGNFNGQNRITLPTHISCNSSYSKDEEYIRDVIALVSSNTKHAQNMLASTLKSINRKEGEKKLKTILRRSTLSNERTESGIYTGDQILTIEIDESRFRRISRKLFRGLYFHDLNLLVDFEDISCFFTSAEQYKYEFENLSNKTSHYWRSIFLSEMNNEMKDENLIIKRRYLRLLENNEVFIIGYSGMGIHNFYFGASFKINEPEGFEHQKYDIVEINLNGI